ncbi:MAG: DUF2188 domain-containing protein [Bacteroidota bacterium]
MRKIPVNELKRRMKADSGSSSRVHVVVRDDGWAVKREGASRASKVFSTKTEAVRGAKSFSKDNDVIIHRKDGTISKWAKAANRRS